MIRKIFSLVLGALLLALSLPAEAQPPAGKVPRIGFLTNGSASDPAAALRFDAFRQGLGALGYVEGKTIIIDSRYAEGRPERLPELAEDLVRLKVDILRRTERPDSPSGQEGDHDHPYRHVEFRQSHWYRGYREPCPAGRQCHGSNKLQRRVARKAPGTFERSPP